MNPKKIIGATVVCALLGSAPVTVNGEKLYWRELVDGSGTVVKRSNLDGAEVELVVDAPAVESIASVGVALDLQNGKMYWSQREGNKILKADLDGGNPEDVLVGLLGPLNIALDIAGGKIYWVQDAGGSSSEPGVLRANLDGSDIEALLDGANFNDIALDLTAGKMYLCEVFVHSGPSRANLDGTGREGLIDPLTFAAEFGSTGATTVALDVAGGKMYFTVQQVLSDPSLIARADLDGSNPEVILTDVIPDPGDPVGFPYGITLDTDSGTMYWSNIFDDRIYTANTDGSEIQLIHQLSGTPGGLALDLTEGPEIPTLSEWAFVAMALLLLVAGTVVCRKRRPIAA